MRGSKIWTFRSWIISTIVSFCLYILAISPSPAFATDLVLVANHNLSVNTLSRKDIRNVFLATKKSINGDIVKPVTIVNHTLTEFFLKQYVRQTPSQFSAYYIRKIFSGGGKKPKEVSSEPEMIRYVSHNKGALGFVSSDAVTEQVKVIQIKD